jgi:hypothetical protein
VFSLFYFQEEEIMQKKEESSRQIVMCHLMTIMGIDVNKATQLVTEMEKLGLIQFDELGNVILLLLEGNHETNNC